MIALTTYADDESVLGALRAGAVVSPATVKSHISHLFAKAGIRDRAQAVRYAYSRGIAQPPQ